ncbi:MAG: lactate/malate family dehydrogenase [Acidobacteriota bacterium]
MRSIVVLGAGDLGGSVARQLAASDASRRIVLVDEDGSIAAGKALDIRQAAPIEGFSTLVEGGQDDSAVIGADLVVIADRAAGHVEWQDEAGVGLLHRILGRQASGWTLCAGAAQMDLVERGVREIGVARHRLLGSAPEALRAAVVSMVTLEAGCSPREISLTVLGRPPDQIIVPWQDASIGGRRLPDVLGAPAIARLDARLPRLWPPGPQALAAAAARTISIAASRGREAVCAFVAVTREEGSRGRVGMLPVIVSPQGASDVLSPTVSARDRVRLDTALQR